MNLVLGGISEYLDSLGATPDEIASTLQTKGIKAKRIHSCECAIAVALEDKYHTPFSVGVNDVLQLDRNKIPTGIKAYLSHHMKEFITRFDQGVYPELLEEPKC